MGGVEDDRRAGLRAGSAARACRRPACCSRKRRRARSPARRPRRRRSSLATTFFMSQGARNCPFLTLTARPVRAGGDQQVGLAAQEGGDLQHVDRLRGERALRGLVHVGSTGRPSVSRISAKIGSAASSPMPRALVAGSAVGLVEGGLEDEADVAPGRDLLQRARHFQRVGPAFELARARRSGRAAGGRRIGRRPGRADLDDGVKRHRATPPASNPAASPPRQAPRAPRRASAIVCSFEPSRRTDTCARPPPCARSRPAREPWRASARAPCS